MSHQHADHASGSSVASKEGGCGGGGGGGCCGGGAKHSHENKQESSEGGCCSNKPASECCKTSGKNAMAAAFKPGMTADEIASLPTLHMLMRAKKGIEHLDQRVFQLTESQIDQAFLPSANVGRWPIRVLIGHLADAEVAAVHRMRRIVGEDNPVVSGWDEDSFVDANLYQNAPKQYADNLESDHARVMHALGGSMAVIHTLRQWSCQWLMSLDESAWDRTMMHPQRGAVSLRKYVALNTWHVEHHAKFLTQKLDHMGIPHEVEEVGGCCGGSGGGGGGGCGCKH